MKLFELCAGLAIALVGATPSLAANCPAVTFSPATIDITTWNPLNTTPVTATVTATIAASANDSAVRLILLDNDTGTPKVSASGPLYVATTGSDTISFPANTDVTTSGVTQIALNNKNAVTSTITFTINGNTALTDFVGGDVYQEAIRYSVACYKNSGSLDSTDVALSANVSLKVTIPKVMTLVSAGPLALDFSANSTAAIRLRSTNGINVAVSTAYGSATGSTTLNKLVLANAPFPYAGNAVIPYTMTLNGNAIFNGSRLVLPRAGVSNALGANYPLVVSMGTPPSAGLIAGTYTDTITLTLSPAS